MGKMEESPTWQNGKHYWHNGPHKIGIKLNIKENVYIYTKN
jgi:hypothetical protein